MNQLRATLPVLAFLLACLLGGCAAPAERTVIYTSGPTQSASSDMSAERFLNELFSAIGNEDADRARRLIEQNPARAMQMQVACEQGIKDGTFVGDQKRIAALLILMVDAVL